MQGDSVSQTTPFTLGELQASYIARLLHDRDRLFVGAGLQVPRAAAILAQLTHAPNMQLSLGLVSTNLLDVPRLEPTKFSTDFRVGRWAEAIVVHNDIFDRPDYVADVFFIGGMQIDQYGNTNLIGIRGPEGGIVARGPGSLGTTSMAHYAKRYYIYAPRHHPEVFVPRVDFISVLGFGNGNGERQKLGLNQYNSGPSAVITPLAVLDFDTPDKRMRLASVHPHVTVDEVLDATGFDLAVEDDVGTTPTPDANQLRLLRERVDIDGSLR